MVDSYQPLTDPQWQVIESILETPARWRRHSLRAVFDAVCYKDRCGCPWRALPPTFPSHSAVEHYFYFWRDSGAFEKVSRRLVELDRQREGREPEPSVVCIDSQSVKLAPRACEHRGKDAHKKVNGRKRHFLVDTVGRLWAALVTSASVHDSRGSLPLVEKLPQARLEKVVADTGYKGRFSRAVEQLGICFELGSRPESEQGFVPIKHRWVVERTIAWTNYYRELLVDFTYNPRSEEAWMYIMNTILCLNRLCPS